MADCKSHQNNPQIPFKVWKFKDKMLKHLRSQAGYENELKFYREVPYMTDMSETRVLSMRMILVRRLNHNLE